MKKRPSPPVYIQAPDIVVSIPNPRFPVLMGQDMAFALVKEMLLDVAKLGETAAVKRLTNEVEAKIMDVDEEMDGLLASVAAAVLLVRGFDPLTVIDVSYDDEARITISFLEPPAANDQEH